MDDKRTNKTDKSYDKYITYRNTYNSPKYVGTILREKYKVVHMYKTKSIYAQFVCITWDTCAMICLKCHDKRISFSMPYGL